LVSFGQFLHKCSRGTLPFIYRHPKKDLLGRIVGDWSSRMKDEDLENWDKADEYGRREEMIKK